MNDLRNIVSSMQEWNDTLLFKAILLSVALVTCVAAMGYMMNVDRHFKRRKRN